MSPSSEREWLTAHGVRPRRALGQNFLLDPRVPQQIVRRAAWDDAPVCEIGPGAGALTAELLRGDRSVRAIEKDPALAALLEDRFREEVAAGRLRITIGDALQVEWTPGEIPGSGVAPAGFWVTGNLPYVITTPLLLKALLQSRARGPAGERRAAGAVFMLQREYADRILAGPADEAYSSISVWTAAHARARLLLRVGRSSFWPRPGVESSVVELTFPDPPPFDGDFASLQRILRAAFGQRRKTLENALAHGLDRTKESIRDLLLAAGCDPAARAETLDLARFASLAARWKAAEAGLP